VTDDQEIPKLYGALICVVKVKVEHYSDVWGGMEKQLHPFLTSVLCELEWLAFTTRAPCSRGNYPWYPLNRRLGGTQSLSWHFGEEQYISPCRESKHDFSIVKPVAQLLHQLSCLSITKVDKSSSHRHTLTHSHCLPLFLSLKVNCGNNIALLYTSTPLSNVRSPLITFQLKFCPPPPMQFKDETERIPFFISFGINLTAVQYITVVG